MIVLVIVVGYLVGSIPVASLVARRHGVDDLREVGDHNPGYWNAKEQLGRRAAVPVFVGDVLKGVVPALLALAVADDGQWWLPYVATGAAMVGHSFPVFAGFRGGRSVLTFVGGSFGRPLLTGIFLLPIVIPPVVIGTMWRLLLGREFGGVNQVLEFIGLAGADWLGDPSLALGAVMFVDIWHWTPFVFLLLLAGLESLDTEVLEAARIDLQSFWQELRYILIPMMAPTLLITLMFRIILSFKVFDEVFLLTSGGPGTATEVINLSIYKTFFGQDRVGDAAAMSVVTLASVTALIVGTNLAIRAWRNRSVKDSA